jgi:hypothetical protein
MARLAKSVGVGALLLAGACGGMADDSYVRGHLLKVAGVSPQAEVAMIDAAIHAAFDVEPGLILRMHPQRLPRTSVDTGAAPTPAAIVSGLRDRGLVAGTCKPVRSAPKNTPHCSTADAGYIIRTSDIFALTADTNEVYFSAEKYGASSGQMPEALRFEKVYQLVKDGSGWRIAREGRLHER